ncbi:MAG: hybrid sensor histidine kinase/response regulator [Pseudohongiella sp.]|nr:MAG: hybrid sensor histidine kinase/response regulator [Pseudohongiella sp.]
MSSLVTDSSTNASIKTAAVNDWQKIEPKEFRIEQIKMLWSHLPLMFLADIATSSFLLLLLVTTAYNPLSFYWYGVLVVVTAGRALHTYRHNQKPSTSYNYNTDWQFLIAGAFISGCIWGSSAFVLPENPSFVTVGLISLWLAGLLAGAATTMSVLREVFFSFAVPVSVLYISYIFLNITENQIPLGGGYILFVAFITPIAMRIAGDFRHSIRLTLQNRNLQEKLKADATSLLEKEAELTKQRKRQSALQTQKAHVDEKLKDADEDRLLLLDAVQEGIFGISNVGSITFINKSALALLGLEEDEVIGMSATKLICPVQDSPDSITQANKAILTSYLIGRPAELLSSAFTKKDGSLMPVRFSSEPIEKAGKIIGAVVSFSDTTSQREMENMLIQSQKMEAIGRLTGGVSHDFNNLLTVIMGNLQFLQHQLADNEKAITLVNKIMNAAKNGAELNSRLLSFSREQELVTAPVNIDEMLKEMHEFLDRILGEDIDLSLNLDDTDCIAMTDRNQLENGILNLCVNAKDAMPTGGKLAISAKTVRLSSSHLGHEENKDLQDYVELTITDTGTGIPLDIQKKVFEPFFTTKDKDEGTGLGLSTTYGFLRQSGGNITVDSIPGEGTTFRLFLPITGEKIGTAPEPVKIVKNKKASYEGKILVVEDDESVRDVASHMLQTVGFDVITAHNGSSGLREYKTNPDIDLVFSDVIMPGGMTGVELASKILELAPDLPILLATGYAEKELKDRLADHKNVVLVAKPYDTNELPDLINSMMLQHPKSG